MKRKAAIALLVVVTGALAANFFSARSTAQFTTFNNELSVLTDEIVEDITKDPTLTGVDKARSRVYAKKADLKKKLAELRNFSPGRTDGATVAAFKNGIIANRAKLAGRVKQLLNDYQKKPRKTDPRILDNLRKLADEYLSLFD